MTGTSLHADVLVPMRYWSRNQPVLVETLLVGQTNQGSRMCSEISIP